MRFSIILPVMFAGLAYGLVIPDRNGLQKRDNPIDYKGSDTWPPHKKRDDPIDYQGSDTWPPHKKRDDPIDYEGSDTWPPHKK
ncbi:hypothetical protein E2P81_ATG09787 [Venturia nashicola]|uniref:Uncharacterized protein n=1 Tax=Venturia nashicola TaxID=86259 RepID=A0A4Z1NX37_9PEZI|nr:hypothetical protein E6O75_ATG10002 [Venturia nashicola]TLD15307.1 hypothetical protein E2P81_ATG09787 [Venturia nashicola]